MNRFWKYRTLPVPFAREQLRLDPDENQQLILNTIAKSLKTTRRTAIRSGHGIGKTYSVGGIAVPWFLVCFPYSKVITTAPTYRQVKDILWAETGSRIKRSKLAEIIDMQETKATIDKDWFAIGVSSDKPANIEGFHAPWIMIVVDETKGVPNKILEAIEGALTTNSLLVYISTPGAAEGSYYETFRKNKHLYETLHIPSAKKIINPDGTYKWVPNSPQITQQWVDDRVAEWGDTSPAFMTRVLGEFVEDAEDALIPMRHLQKASHMYDELGDISLLFQKTDQVRRRVMGIDVADMGSDSTVFQLVDHMKDGRRIRIAFKSYNKQDTEITGDKADSFAVDWDVDQINIDKIGIGAGVFHKLEHKKREQKRKYTVRGINVGIRPTNNADLYMSLKSQLWWNVRKMFENGEVLIPEGDTKDLTYAQCASMKWETSPNEKIRIIDPEKSPDFADALMLALNKEYMSSTVISI